MWHQSASILMRRGQAGAGLLAHVLVAKLCDHLPLFRQSKIYASHGVDPERLFLVDWVGQVSTVMLPLVDELKRHVLGADRLHANDTPVLDLPPRLRTGD